MQIPHLYLQLQQQMRQWIKPKDKRHLQGFAEAVAAILQSGSASLSHWLPYLSHRDCKARSQMERLNYFVHNPRIIAETFYNPLLKHFLQAFAGASLEVALDTSMLWDKFCLIEVCLIWGGRSICLAQVVLEHRSATVGFEDYRPVLEQVLTLLPPKSTVTLLADRGFEHGELIRWLNRNRWSWAIRAKTDLQVTLATGSTKSVEQLIPPSEQAYLFPDVTVLGDINCHLATANLAMANGSWAVLTAISPSLQTFALYGRRFGGIEPHFKDYKSGAFDIVSSHLRDAQALTCLFMLLATASLIALILGMMLVRLGQRAWIDWHDHRGLSFLQLGLRQLHSLLYQQKLLPQLEILPKSNPPPACASIAKREMLDFRIEFSRVTTVSR
ncbi:transposase [Pseudanabaena sp. BC1403]|uniref:transposase n=1 Tax=Pseudanabaena sp. BC1403 TaxID=2043171 RepID=UPI000CD82D07|nr:transposase [Pseudanabaena sp. BC1403]